MPGSSPLSASSTNPTSLALPRAFTIVSSVTIAVNSLRVARECAPVANAAIAHRSNLCLIDVLDALLDFAVFVEYAAFAVLASARACMRVIADLRQNSD